MLNVTRLVNYPLKLEHETPPTCYEVIWFAMVPANEGTRLVKSNHSHTTRQASHVSKEPGLQCMLQRAGMAEEDYT